MAWLMCILSRPLGFYCSSRCQLRMCILSRGSLNKEEVIVCQLAVTGGDTLVRADHRQWNIHDITTSGTPLLIQQEMKALMEDLVTK